MKLVSAWTPQTSFGFEKKTCLHSRVNTYIKFNNRIYNGFLLVSDNKYLLTWLANPCYRCICGSSEFKQIKLMGVSE